MKAIVVSLLGLLTASILSGCAYQPEQRVVDFSAVDASQPGATFELRVKVVGLDDGSKPIAGAFVGAAEGAQAIAKDTTDADGIALLRVKSGQTVRIVASAPGWTTEDSGSIRIGRGSDTNNNLPMAGCSGGAAQNSDGQAAGGWCIVTAGQDDSQSVSLEGSNGSVSVVLFPREVRQGFRQDIGPNLNAQFTTLPDGNQWIALPHNLQEDPALQELQMLRFHNATTTMQWNNDMLSQADFELGVGCADGSPMAESDELVPTLQRQTYHLEVVFEGENDGRWSACPTYFVGPIVSTGNSPVEVRLESVMTFRGRSTIIPIQ